MVSMSFEDLKLWCHNCDDEFPVADNWDLFDDFVCPFCGTIHDTEWDFDDGYIVWTKNPNNTRR